MDLVTLTDLDTIDGCLAFLERHTEAGDFFISEEVEARDPRTGARPRVLLYDITEAQHREAQRLRGDVRELAAYALSEGIAAALGPFLETLPEDGRPGEGGRAILALFDRFEIRNGASSSEQNRLVLRLVQEEAAGRPLGLTGGSGAHGPARAGRTATAAPGATRAEFLHHLRERRTWVAGSEGSRWAAAADLLRVLRRESPDLAAGASLLSHGLRRARLESRIRQARRRLDRLEVLRFQEKARSYTPGRTTPGADPPEAGRAGARPDTETQPQRLVFL